MKKFLKIVLIVLAAILVVAVGLVAFICLSEYMPADVEPITVKGENTGMKVETDKEYVAVSWNIGYAGLDKARDSVLDGGGSAPAPSYDDVTTNLKNIKSILDGYKADFYLLQEVDSDSSRTYSIDQRDTLSYGNETYALNYSAPFVPFPIPNMILKVHSGVFTTTMYDVDSADRYSLPNPFSWPIRAANLKRCLNVTYLPIADSDKKLVIINFHLEAYTSGEAKTEQTVQLVNLIKEEFKKGNYVIAGGDWNQAMPGALEKYPNTHEDLWEVSNVESNLFDSQVEIQSDLTNPSCRLLNQPYNPDDTENTQYYVIDGFVCTPNVQISSVQTVQENFEYSDHNPVILNFCLKPEN